MTVKKNKLEQQRIEMATLLGLDKPVSEKVLKAAIADSTYAQHLLVCREEPEFLQHLLTHPPTLHTEEDTENISTPALIASATDSLLRWAKTGFSTVSEEIYQNRLAVCSVCPHLKTPPQNKQAIYALVGVSIDDQTICGKCGCVAMAKARRSSDTCPDPHPELSGFNRWGESVVIEN